MMVDMRHSIINNGSVNGNTGAHDSIDNDIDDTDNIDFSSNKEVTIQLATFPYQKTVALKIRCHLSFMRG